MYAVLRHGGKQYKVSPGASLNLEKFEGDVGTKVSMEDVLLVSDGKSVEIGKPVVEKAKVEAEIIEQGKGPKLKIFTYRRRHNSQRTKGHRQPFTRVRINSITDAAGKSHEAKVEAKAKKAEKKPATKKSKTSKTKTASEKKTS